MRLHVGQRLPGSGPPGQPGGHVVTAVAAETPWYGLYAAKKICYHFDFTAKCPREAGEAEWLDVYLRTVQYPRNDDPAYVAGRRSLARAELRRILGNRTSNLWPEPLDLIEIHNSLESGSEPIIAFARPKGEPLARWQQQVQPLALVLGVLAELLEFIQAAHDDGLLLNGLDPEAVIVDAVGRVHYLGSDMAVEMPGGTVPLLDWEKFFPPARYPVAYSPPECFYPNRGRDSRTDLYAWAALVYFLLTRDQPEQLARDQGQPWVLFGRPQWEQLESALRAIPPAHVRSWGEQLGVDSEFLVRGWPHNMLAVLRRPLDPDPHERPKTVSELRHSLSHPKTFISQLEAPARAALAGASGWEGKLPAEKLLVKRLCRTLQAIPDQDLGQVVAEMAQAIIASGNGSRLAPELASLTGTAEDPNRTAWLALELTARLTAPLPTALIASVRPLLSIKGLPREVRFDAAASLLHATGKAGPEAAAILQALVARRGKARSIECLRLLEKRVGHSPAIEELCRLLEDQIRMICPRCSVELLRPAMRTHLWEEHRLILDGRRVRKG